MILSLCTSSDYAVVCSLPLAVLQTEVVLGPCKHLNPLDPICNRNVCLPIHILLSSIRLVLRQLLTLLPHSALKNFPNIVYHPYAVCNRTILPVFCLCSRQWQVDQGNDGCCNRLFCLLLGGRRRRRRQWQVFVELI